MDKSYHLGLLYLIHQLINADGVADRSEFDALCNKKREENIPDTSYHEFEENTKSKTEQEIYQSGFEFNEVVDYTKTNPPIF